MPETSKKFTFSETVRNISQIEDGESYFTDKKVHYNIPWRMQIRKSNDSFDFYLRCEKQERMDILWSIKTEFTLKLESHNGNCLMRTLNFTFEKPKGSGWGKFISWKDLKRDYVVDDSIKIEASVIIIHVSEYDNTFLNEQTNYQSFGGVIEITNKKFVIRQTFNNVFKFADQHDYYSATENKFDIPWRLKVVKGKGYLECYLQCDKAESKERKWSIETMLTLMLVSLNRSSLVKTGSFTFQKSEGLGWNQFIRWKDLIANYTVDDSIVLEAYVTIIKVSDSPRPENNAKKSNLKNTAKVTWGNEVRDKQVSTTNSSRNATKNQKTFVLTHTVNNVSSIRDGSQYFTNTEIRYSVPWRIKLQRGNEFFKLRLQCDKQSSRSNIWKIETEFELVLKSLNGQKFSKNTKYTFTQSESYGPFEFIKWDEMKRKYAANDSVIVEAHVTIIKMFGIGAETRFDGVDNDLSGHVINVGGQKYALEKL